MQVTDSGLIFDATAVEGPLRVCSFTSLLRLDSGTLLASFRRGSAKDSADGNVVICESTDEGANWSVISEGFETTFEGLPGEFPSRGRAPTISATRNTIRPVWTLRGPYCLVSGSSTSLKSGSKIGSVPS